MQIENGPRPSSEAPFLCLWPLYADTVHNNSLDECRRLLHYTESRTNRLTLQAKITGQDQQNT
jgi:hypothetical protein